MEFSLLNSRKDDEYSSDSFVGISEVFVMLDEFFFGADSFGKVYIGLHSVHPPPLVCCIPLIPHPTYR